MRITAIAVDQTSAFILANLFEKNAMIIFDRGAPRALLSAAASVTTYAVALFAPLESIAQIIELPPVEIRSGRPTSILSNIPTTTEGIDAKRIDTTINATDSSDALKYLPSLLVRKRYIGDFDHAVLATRASGTGNSARSLVYADGMLLSNLLGNGASFTPRWGLVTPEEIERVDVLYGPFSAAYSGNSVGAVVDYLTRMPTQFEMHAKAGFFSQTFELFGTKNHYTGNQMSGSIGSAVGPWSWWLNASRQTSDGHPIAFVTRLVAQGTASNNGTPVSGAIAGLDPRNRDWLILGSTNQIHTVQNHVKAKLGYEFSPTIQFNYTLGVWQNDAKRYAQTYLKDATGDLVYSGNVNVAGRQFALTSTDFANALNALNHIAHGLTLKTNTKSFFDWDIAASFYDYNKDEVRVPSVTLPSSRAGGAGRITDQKGTGWSTLNMHGVIRTDGSTASTHVIDFGVQRDAFTLRSQVNVTDNWFSGSAGARFSAFTGNTTLTSLYVQDTWRARPDIKSSFGLRYEDWYAFNGSLANSSALINLGPRRESNWSPKAALAIETAANLTFKGSIGRAVRFPTVSELYQGSVSGNTIVNNDPNLRPERSVTAELSAEYALSQGNLRATIFRESTRDALYSQTNVTVQPNVTNIQNIDQIRTLGLELAGQLNDVGIKGLNIASSVTYADSSIVANARFPASVSKRQPRVPIWRANVVTSYEPNEQWSVSLGIRFSGRQYGTLDNIDINDQTYTSVSRFLVADLRTRFKFTKEWSIALGVDNINNAKYWAFHPYPQRTLHAELRFN